MKRGFQRILICILLVSLLNFNGLGDLCIVHASANVASGNMKELGNGINSGSFSQNEVKIDFVLNGNWDSGHNVTVIIQNLSETNTIENWQLSSKRPPIIMAILVSMYREVFIRQSFFRSDQDFKTRNVILMK